MNSNATNSGKVNEEKEFSDNRKAWHVPELSESNYANLTDVIIGGSPP
ncbi:MAG: hypothetical protein HQM10_08715 [Candidatus Riflebacteria bacterium]|nr:hypothetical protein [Candidatus Riflebacteria bacterium]